MSTLAQIEANRANAQLSTGPTSPEGKAKVSQNHLSHGYSAKTPFVPDELKPDFEDLKARLLNTCRPHGDLELQLTNRLIHSSWVLTRLDFDEAGLLFNSGGNAFACPDSAKGLSLILRYRTSHTSVFFRNLRELRQLQTDRMALAGFHSKLQEPVQDESPLAYITRLTKHTDLKISLEANQQHHFLEGKRYLEEKYKEAKAKIAAGDPETKTAQFKANFETLDAMWRPWRPQLAARGKKFVALK